MSWAVDYFILSEDGVRQMFQRMMDLVRVEDRRPYAVLYRYIQDSEYDLAAKPDDTLLLVERDHPWDGGKTIPARVLLEQCIARCIERQNGKMDSYHRQCLCEDEEELRLLLDAYSEGKRRKARPAKQSTQFECCPDPWAEELMDLDSFLHYDSEPPLSEEEIAAIEDGCHSAERNGNKDQYVDPVLLF